MHWHKKEDDWKGQENLVPCEPLLHLFKIKLNKWINREKKGASPVDGWQARRRKLELSAIMVAYVKSDFSISSSRLSVLCNNLQTFQIGAVPFSPYVFIYFLLPFPFIIITPKLKLFFYPLQTDKCYFSPDWDQNISNFSVLQLCRTFHCLFMLRIFPFIFLQYC